MLKGAIFDFDGTLFDSMFIWDTAGEVYLRSIGIEPKEYVVAFLEQMKEQGVRMCIATATDRYQVEAALKRCGMEYFFSEIFTCTDVEHGKDELVIFRKAMEYLRTTKENTVVF